MCNLGAISTFCKSSYFNSAVKYTACALITSFAIKKIIDIFSATPNPPTIKPRATPPVNRNKALVLTMVSSDTTEPGPDSTALVASTHRKTSGGRPSTTIIHFKPTPHELTMIFGWDERGKTPDRLGIEDRGASGKKKCSMLQRFVKEGHRPYCHPQIVSRDTIIGTIYFASETAYWVEHDIIEGKDQVARAMHILALVTTAVEGTFASSKPISDASIYFATLTAKRLFQLVESTRGSAYDKAFEVYRSILVEGITTPTGNIPFPIGKYSDIIMTMREEIVMKRLGELNMKMLAGKIANGEEIRGAPKPLRTSHLLTN